MVKLIEIRPEEGVVESCPPEEIETERLLTNVIEINNTEMIKTTVKEKYEKYIGTLRETISKFQNEWDTLYDSYHSLLGDIKSLIINNEKLKSMVLDLEGKVESHNKQILSNDGNIKQQIELLTKNTLSKKTIDWMSQKEVMVKTSKEMEAINSKVKRMEMTQFNSSSLLNSVNADMDNFVTENNSSNMHSRSINTGNIKDNGYGSVVRTEIVVDVTPIAGQESNTYGTGSSTIGNYSSGVQNAGTIGTGSSTIINSSGIQDASTYGSSSNINVSNLRKDSDISFTTTTTSKGDTVTKSIKKK